ncbi:tRNA modification GTPase [Rubinisphaera brasiliensis]|uniref:tRNA modification GTPase MnmE n=1 Tax=Rubinisphaera brasiliensis (strain ATCC 49424 / DSM 5305 / JCM 21570 / IAM 15109 / NBRC 103401 / IFAM 1448) TaxID=756272 RepID=F0SL17_RUBBR|nr:tRNA modification GTPase [Rubinisphaera brasiliensis]ADY59870.1 tRNA modification GTPase mnmE [Rubinisphaera brasiliensis DSM 5305]
MYSASDWNPDETIAALASAPGPGQRGIVRISGEETVALLNSLLEDSPNAPEFDNRRAKRYPVEICLGERGGSFPMAVHVWPGQRSYTGQPSAELHLLGAPPILDWLLGRIYKLGARPAQPGEFTLRSFLSGRLSLVQAEAVLGVIDARGNAQLDVALQQLAGGVSQRMRRMRDQLLEDLADLEAGLDFVEEDIEFIDRAEFADRLQNWQSEVALLCEAADRRMHSAEEPRIVLAGLPNAGKSSLFNALTGETAIVSDIEGTTTDYLVGRTQLTGTNVAIFDTAGWETGSNPIGELAQVFRQSGYEQADLIVWCTPADWSKDQRQADDIHFDKLASGAVPTIRVCTKTDRAKAVTTTEEHEDAARNGRFTCGATATQAGGLDALKAAIAEAVSENQGQSQELLGSTAARCRDSLFRTRSHLEEACHLAETSLGDEFLAEELRGAIQELGVILGHVYTDDLLDRVFSKFCIGK